MGIEPTYLSPEDIISAGSCDVVGYGSKGDYGAKGTCCDGRKRAVINYFTGIYRPPPILESHLVYSYFGADHDPNPPYPPVLRSLRDYEGGIRPGMSGGGVFV